MTEAGRRVWLLVGVLAVAVARAGDPHVFEEAFELQRAGKLDDAAAKYEQGLKAEPGNAQAHFYLGETYRALKQWARAAREYERAAALAGDEPVGQQAKSRLNSLPAPPPQIVALLKSVEDSLVKVPGGAFQMGDPSRSGSPDEQPAHQVTLRPFLLAMAPVTFEQYDVYAQETGRTKPDDHGWGRGRHPVVGVSWDAATGFLTWLNKQGTEHYRLPSEAEWEYAARAGTSGTSPNVSLQSAADSPTEDPDEERTRAVAQGAPNPWGLYDMMGGVFEWVQDCYQEDYAGAPADGSAWVAGDCSRRVARGGPHKGLAALSVTTRHWHVETFHFGLRGFRLARDY